MVHLQSVRCIQAAGLKIGPAVCCVYATEPSTQPGIITWKRRTSAGASVCATPLAWGLASRAAHESICPYGAQVRAQTLESRRQAVQNAKDALHTATATVQAIEGFPDLTNGNVADIREQLQEQVIACNRVLSTFDNDTDWVGVLGVPPNEENKIVFQLRRFREDLEEALLHASRDEGSQHEREESEDDQEVNARV